MPFALPDDASQHLQDLWHARAQLLDQLAIVANPGAVVVQLTGALANIDAQIANLCPAFTSEATSPKGGADLDEFTRRAQAAQRRAG